MISSLVHQFAWQVLAYLCECCKCCWGLRVHRQYFIGKKADGIEFVNKDPLLNILRMLKFGHKTVLAIFRDRYMFFPQNIAFILLYLQEFTILKNISKRGVDTLCFITLKFMNIFRNIRYWKKIEVKLCVDSRNINIKPLKGQKQYYVLL